MKKLSILLIFILSFSGIFAAPPDEGMWLLHLLKLVNEQDMRAKGLKLTAEDIYSVNKASLKDAVVQFGGGCTGEMISSEGLLLTNHHCGRGQIQSHSSVEKDYLKNGFWAMNRQEELACPGLTVTFIIRIEDVTAKALEGTESLPDADRDTKIKANIAEINKNATKDSHYNSFVRPIYYGAEYLLFVTEVFKDVRMVGAPPSSIGNFGGDTDNWMWPRHTGDFSLFRVYAGKDNKPAEYSKDNVPFKPRHHLPISLKGIQKGDFTMVMGFPGRTQEYITSYAVKRILEDSNPYKIKIRGDRMAIMDRYMKQSDKIRIQYSAKYYGISNAWKKWIGENRGLKKLNAIKRKQALENQFSSWANGSNERKQMYGELLNNIKKAYESLGEVGLAEDYFNEVVFGSEIISFAYNISNILNQNPADAKEKIRKQAKSFFKDFHAPCDQELLALCLKTYFKDLKRHFYPEFFTKLEQDFAGDFDNFAAYVFKASSLTSEDKLMKLLDGSGEGSLGASLEQDVAIGMIADFMKVYFAKVAPVSKQANQVIEKNQALYVRGLREMLKDKKFYPDANSTLRLTFGKVDTYAPFDGAQYHFATTLDGLIEKADLGGAEDYVIPERLRELFNKKDYGVYGQNGKLPVCFISSNHTTGGNSGSPIINASGQLIGLNFDRNWEGTMSDIMYDPDQCRNIGVDVRYVLFIIDKFAGAKHLINEMSLVN